MTPREAVRTRLAARLPGRAVPATGEEARLRRELARMQQHVSSLENELRRRGKTAASPAVAAAPAPAKVPSARTAKHAPAKIMSTAEYEQLKVRVRLSAGQAIPPGATVTVISRGDNDMLNLGGRRGWHFPRRDDGVYAGHYPADGAAALAHLQLQWAQGAEYLVVPAIASWWVDFYSELGDYLRGRCRLVHREPACAIYSLPAATKPRVATPTSAARQPQLVRQVRQLVASLLPRNASVLVISKGDDELLKLGPRHGAHFPQGPDGKYDLREFPDGGQVLSHLDSLRQTGAQYLLIPAPSYWWLDYYRDLRQFLERRCQRIAFQRHVCMLYRFPDDKKKALGR